MNTHLTLKQLKHSAFASQETHCYEAELRYKGKKAARISNGGYGGADEVHFVSDDMQSQVLAYAEANLRDECTNPDFHDLYEHASGYTLLELWAGNEVNRQLEQKELKKLLSKRVLYKKHKQAGIYQTKPARSAAQRDAWIQHVKQDNTTEVILNELPINEAVQWLLENQ